MHSIIRLVMHLVREKASMNPSPRKCIMKDVANITKTTTIWTHIYNQSFRVIAPNRHRIELMPCVTQTVKVLEQLSSTCNFLTGELAPAVTLSMKTHQHVNKCTWIYQVQIRGKTWFLCPGKTVGAITCLVDLLVVRFIATCSAKPCTVVGCTI